MNLQNGYKVIYEKAAEGERTFYAAKSTTYPNVDDTVLASFTDKDFCGKVVYEYQGKLYVSKGTVPAFDDNGESTDTEIEGFDQVFKKASGDHNATTVVKPQSPHAEAIETNGDSHGMLTIEGNIVTLNATGEIEPKTNPNGNTYHHVGFKITTPEGIDPTNVVITRPDGKTRVMANILDGANFTNMYWKPTEEDRVFTYYIDWNNDGVNDLTVIIDATKATLLSEEPVVEV